MSARRVHHLDWLRAIAVVGVVMYHALLPFSSWLFIANDQRSAVLIGIVVLLVAFGLPILFLVAGASTRFALETRSTRILNWRPWPNW